MQSIIVKCQWWWVAAHIQNIIYNSNKPPRLSGWGSITTRSGITFEGHYESPPIVLDIRLICTIAGEGNQTQITTIEHAPFIGYWKPVLASVANLEQAARKIRRDSIGATADAIIEEYKRAKNANESVSLRQLADEAGISYEYLRKRKSIKERQDQGEH